MKAEIKDLYGFSVSYSSISKFLNESGNYKEASITYLNVFCLYLHEGLDKMLSLDYEAEQSLNVDVVKLKTFPLIGCNYSNVSRREAIASAELRRLSTELNSAMLFFYQNYGTMCEVVWHRGEVVGNKFLEVNITCTPDRCTWNGSL
jgi:hypothetical protein